MTRFATDAEFDAIIDAATEAELDAAIDAAIEALEHNGTFERIPGESAWWYNTIRVSKTFLSKLIIVEGVDKVVLEIRKGVVLFLNECASPGESDGWWWGTAEYPTMIGPFADAKAAVKDASELWAGPIKVIEHTDCEMGMIHTPGVVTINIINTDGEIWTHVDETPVTGRALS